MIAQKPYRSRVNNIFLHFQGRYNYYEGGIKLSGADAEDDGEWSCEFESWDSNGVRGDGEIAKVIFFNCPSVLPWLLLKVEN